MTTPTAKDTGGAGKLGPLHVGEDGAALFDEHGRRVASMGLLSFLEGTEEVGDKAMQSARARRLALAQLFAAAEAMAEAIEDALSDLGPGGYLLPSGKPKTDALRSALAKAGRL